jgi:hypothetical protein
MAYQGGAVRRTTLAQVGGSESVTVTVGAGRGTYDGALESRDNVVALAMGGKPVVEGVTLRVGDAVPLLLPRYDTRSEFDSATQGWIYVEPGAVLAKSGVQDVAAEKEFVFHQGASRPAYAPWLWRDLEKPAESAAHVSSCTDRVCCELGIDCQQMVYLPLFGGRR